MQVDWGVQGLDMARGQALAPAGDNGSGRSTPIKVIAGVEAADAGEIQVDAADWIEKTAANASRLACRSSTRLGRLGCAALARFAPSIRKPIVNFQDSVHSAGAVQTISQSGCRLRSGRATGSASLSPRLKPAPQGGGG